MTKLGFYVELLKKVEIEVLCALLEKLGGLIVILRVIILHLKLRFKMKNLD